MKGSFMWWAIMKANIKFGMYNGLEIFYVMSNFDIIEVVELVS